MFCVHAENLVCVVTLDIPLPFLVKEHCTSLYKFLQVFIFATFPPSWWKNIVTLHANVLSACWKSCMCCYTRYTPSFFGERTLYFSLQVFTGFHFWWKKFVFWHTTFYRTSFLVKNIVLLLTSFISDSKNM